MTDLEELAVALPEAAVKAWLPENAEQEEPAEG